MTFLIIGAMEKEISALKNKFGGSTDSNGNTVTKKGDSTVIFAVSGVGKVNAAATTQKLICTYNPDYVLNTGVAGGIASDIALGELVIGTQLTYHDFDPLELLDRYPPFNKMFGCDQKLSDLACDACDSLGVKYRKGVIVSGDCFVNDGNVKNRIQKEFAAECTEMEGAAIAHTCMLNNTKFLVIRAVCDFADSTADMINQFENIAADIAASVSEYIINNI